MAGKRTLCGAVGLVALWSAVSAAMGLEYRETPALEARVRAGDLPPVAERLPAAPRVVTPRTPGRHGGDLRILMSRARDTRIMTVYGYARLVGYDRDYRLVPDILAAYEVEAGRIFTFHLRPGHKWSDGHPFTAADFRYYWEHVALNERLQSFGPPPIFRVDGELPVFEVLDRHTVRYSWRKPNPFFLPGLAAPRPPFIYRPAHFLRHFHGDLADPAQLAAEIAARKMQDWAQLHNVADNMYRNDNPDLPTLQPWRNTIRPPAQQFVFVRNPYFHRIDPEGRQLPYIDRVLMNITDGKLIPAKAGAGETDLQARQIFMHNYTFLRQAGERENIATHIWRSARGAELALFPNLNHQDPVWRQLFRDVRFRRALSLGIDRDEINELVFYGLGTGSNNTVTDASPLFRDDLRHRWTAFDPDMANRLLDDIGLADRDDRGIRRLPDGRPLEIVVETAGGGTEAVDVLQLIHDTWQDRLGIKMFTRPAQTEVFRNRVFAGETQMAAAPGIDNGIPTVDMSPEDFVPVRQIQYQWPKWGQHYETRGGAGEAPDMPEARTLLALFDAWRGATDDAARHAAWEQILDIHAEQLFSIGIVCCGGQPVVVSNRLRNLPEDGLYGWDPGAHFGIYLPDTFYLDPAP